MSGLGSRRITYRLGLEFYPVNLRSFETVAPELGERPRAREGHLPRDRSHLGMKVVKQGNNETRETS